MADLKHIKTFENYTQPEVTEKVTEEVIETEDIEQINEELFDSRKKKIDAYLSNPEEGKKVDKVLSTAFAKSFGANPKLKADVLAQTQEQKIDILKQASEKLSDPKVGPLKLFKRGDTYQVGGIGTIAGTGGGHRS